MSPFLILVLFGFIQVGLKASIIKRDDCVNDEEEAMKLLGFNCIEIALNDDIPGEILCDRDDVKAVCPVGCDLGRCWNPGAPIDGYADGDHGSNGGSESLVHSFGAY